MRGDLKTSMMPLAPAAMLPPHRTATSTNKPKLGFSIESIVGLEPSSKDKSSPVPDDKDSCSDGEVTTLTPPPAHSHSKLTTSSNSSFYRVGEDVYSGYSHYSPQRVPAARTPEYAHRSEMLSHHGQHSAIPYPTVISPYGAALGLGHCHGQYPLSSYLVNRDYPSYTWMMSRQPRILPYRPQGSQSASFILHQFRKPKRIRTAFSPSQLLTLEHAFEKNHYVVGTERKQLAQNLNLTETQVKVWFQNRRTKHKRQKQEEQQGGRQSDGQKEGKEDDESKDGRSSPLSPGMEDSDDYPCDDEDDDCDDAVFEHQNAAFEHQNPAS